MAGGRPALISADTWETCSDASDKGAVAESEADCKKQLKDDWGGRKTQPSVSPDHLTALHIDPL